MQFSVAVPDVAFVTWFASVIAGVHETEVSVVLATIVPEALPKAYVMVCVNELAALEMEIVDALPIVPALMLILDALGMESKVIAALALMLA